MQSQGLILPPEPEVGFSAARVSTKESFVDPSENDPDTDDSDKCGFNRHMTETSMRVGNVDVYGFLEPQSIQRSGQSQFESKSYIKNWMQKSKRDVYLAAYLNGPHNYLKGIINSALKGLNDTPQSKSKVVVRWIVVKCNRQKGSTECGYYVMHWMSTIILGSFKNNWKMYFNDARPLEPKRLKALRIQWAKYYLKIKNET
ncbi:hypothetical protein HKD37_05G013004 [Glycine soja]